MNGIGGMYIRTVLVAVVALHAPWWGVHSAAAQPRWAKKALKLLDSASSKYPKADRILWERVEIRMDEGPKGVKHVRRVWKILSDDGGFSNVSLALTPFEEVMFFRAWIRYPNGKKKKLITSDLSQEQCVDVGGMYTDVRYEWMSWGTKPGAGGAIIYEYKLLAKGWDSIDWGRSWVFRHPVCYSEFRLDVPSDWEVRSLATRWVPREKQQKKNRVVYTWRVADLPWIDTSVPYLPPLRHFRPALFVVAYDSANTNTVMYRSWEDMRRWLRLAFEEHCRVDAAIRRRVSEIADTCSTVTSRLRAIAEFVRDRIRYVAVEIGKGRIIPRDASFVLQQRYGDCKDKAVLLVTMLRDAGIQAYPALCHTTQYVPTRFPSLSFFNHVIVAVPVDSSLRGLEPWTVDGLLFFDPTDEGAELESVPEYLKGDYALVLRDSCDVLVKVPRSARIGSEIRTVVDAQLEEDGSATFKVKITDLGKDFAIWKRTARKYSTKEMTDSWKAEIQESNPGKEVQVHPVHISVMNDSVTCNLSFTVRGYADRFVRQRAFRVIPTFLAAEYVEPDCKNRNYPFWLGGYEQRDYVVRWRVSGNWTIEVDPPSYEAVSEPASFHFRTAVEDSILNLVATYRQSYKIVGSEQCTAIKKVLKGMNLMYRLRAWLYPADR